jgi:hypothetical protein
MIRRQFDTLYAEGAQSGRVMAMVPSGVWLELKVA